MKKVFCLFLVLVLFPFASLADYDDSIFPGVWVCVRETDYGDTIINYFYLFDDHTAYYSSQKFNTSSRLNKTSGQFCIWKYSNDELIITNEELISLYYYVVNESCFAYDKKGTINPFVKVSYDNLENKERK